MSELTLQGFVNEFGRNTRENNEEYYYLESNDSPYLELVREIHEGRLPNDFDFETAYDVANALNQCIEDNNGTISYYAIDALAEGLTEFRTYSLVSMLRCSDFLEDANRFDDCNIEQACAMAHYDKLQRAASVILEFFNIEIED